MTTEFITKNIAKDLSLKDTAVTSSLTAQPPPSSQDTEKKEQAVLTKQKSDRYMKNSNTTKNLKKEKRQS